jgi:hypothetical protein
MKIEITLTTFYARGDERRFFQGLSEIRGVTNFEGKGRNLIVTLNVRYLNREQLFEFIALLWRYNIPLCPLNFLAKSKKFEWINDEKYYWYSSMFGTHSPRSSD